MIGGLVSQGLKFLVIIYVARQFSVSEFGLLSFAWAVYAYQFVVCTSGLQFFGSRAVAKSGQVSGALLAEISCLRAALAVVGIAGSLAVLALLPGVSRTEFLLVAASTGGGTCCADRLGRPRRRRIDGRAATPISSRRPISCWDAGRKTRSISRARPEKVRERYGKHLWCQQALLARRLVQAGVAFVTLDLSYHGASGTWDTHGDNIPPYGGIKRGLGPLLPLFDHLLTTLVINLEERGLLERRLVIAMGEFGRTPLMGTQGSSDGRNHWPVCMSMALAGGGLRHGQVIGATEADGGQIKDRPVTPGDLAATIYHTWAYRLERHLPDPRGRPRYIVENGRPIAELS